MEKLPGEDIPKKHREDIVRARRIKDRAKEEEIRSSLGALSPEGGSSVLHRSIAEAIDYATDFFESHQADIEGIVNFFAEQHGFSHGEIKDVFLASLKRRVVQFVRLYEPEEVQHEDLVFLVRMHFRDFLHILRESFARKESKRQLFAKLDNAHWYDPGTIRRMESAYPDVDRSLIRQLALNNVRQDTSESIDWYLQRLKILQRHAPDEDISILKQLSRTFDADPVALYDAYRGRYEALKNMYPDAYSSALERFAIAYSDDTYMEAMKRYMKITEEGARVLSEDEAQGFQWTALYSPQKAARMIEAVKKRREK